MKNRLVIPVILLMSFMLSSFQEKARPATGIFPPQTITASQLDRLFGEYSSCAWITQLIHNGQDITKNYDRNIFCFHPDGTVEFCNDLYCVRGTWKIDQDIIEISINAAATYVDNASGAANGAYDWLNGTWKILERTETSLEIEKISKDYWRVRFETIMR